MFRALLFVAMALLLGTSFPAKARNEDSLCLDGFCIGQDINNARFDQVKWETPTKYYTQEKCSGVGCQPNIAFYGYNHELQNKLAEAVSWKYGVDQYTVITENNLSIFRQYKYECNPSARAPFGERRFLGIYKSIPSGYLTVVGLRLIGDKLVVYRISRKYPYQTQDELIDLAKKMRAEYGSHILLYDYLSSNAYSDVIKQKKDGWFGRSQMFNPADLSDNSAELVLIDPQTRLLLEPTSVPQSGDVKPLPVRMVPQCDKSMPLQ